MTIDDLLQKLRTAPAALQFEEVIATINAHYDFTPTHFSNGAADNPAGKNEGACRVFAFAQLHKLDAQETLNCFAQHYRAVLDHPAGDDHANIRAFMQTGQAGIHFDRFPLTAKATGS